MPDLRRQIKLGLQAFVQRNGIFVMRYPLQTCLKFISPTTVLDVGANVGQYAHELQNLGFRGTLHSFEPFPPSFAELQKQAEQSHRFKAWHCYNCGLGEKEGEMKMNVSKDSVFNSLREVLPESKDLNRWIETEKSVPVKIRTLDAVWQELNLAKERVFLKMDTQGWELPVLLGGKSALEKIAAIQMEVSLTPLYKGQPCVEDVVPFLRDRGFQVYGAWPGEGIRGKQHQVYEVDFIFVKA